MYLYQEHSGSKTDKRIFSRAAERMGILPQEICYVGDSFENDIVGAKAAGWNAVWYNHRDIRQQVM